MLIVLVGDNEAEQIKIQVGSVLEDLPSEIAPSDIDVIGRNSVTGLPIEVRISYKEIAGRRPPEYWEHSISLRYLQKLQCEYQCAVSRDSFYAG